MRHPNWRQEIPEEFSYLDINPQMEKALEVIFNSRNNLLILGNGGSGKSELINLLQKITKYDYDTAFLAPTGVAATRINGQTVHSFFKFAPEIYQFGTIFKKSPKQKEYLRSILSNVNRIIIDEVSMVRADLMDGIDEILRVTFDSAMPFAGKQIVLVGDIFQLPPVVNTSDEKEKDYFTHYYNDNPHFFGSEVFLKCSTMYSDLFKYVEFVKIYRQEEKDFTDILNRIRKDRYTGTDLYRLNTHKADFLDFAMKHPDHVYLATTNKAVDSKNEEFLNMIDHPLEIFMAKTEGDVNPKNHLVPFELRLKKNSKVMFLANEPNGAWVNGTIGFFIGTSETYDGEQVLLVEIDEQVVQVPKQVWEEIEYQSAKTDEDDSLPTKEYLEQNIQMLKELLDRQKELSKLIEAEEELDEDTQSEILSEEEILRIDEDIKKYERALDAKQYKRPQLEKNVKGKVTQFPVKLAFAVTIHKSQSATYESAYVDLGWKVFAPHMVYVALSRIKTKEGLGLKRNIMERDIYIDDFVKEFYETKFSNWIRQAQ